MVFIKKEHTTNTATLVENRDMRDLFNYYYDKSIFTDLKNMNEKLKSNSIFIISNIQDVKGIDFSKYNKVILTQTFVKPGNENDTIINHISNHYKNQIANKDYKGVDILVFSN
jgi:cobalamin biosynthesis Co2+ chelatase CbiK